LDIRACGPDGKLYLADPENMVRCNKVMHIEKNCAVLDSRTIGCDLTLLWRLSRYAAMLAMASIKDKDTGDYVLPRDSLRRKFLSGEAAAVSNAQKIANLRQIRESFAREPLKSADKIRERVLQGFLRFIILHEFGHIVNGHVKGGALPACAMTNQNDLSSVCSITDKNELEADEFTIKRIVTGIMPDQFTPDRAISELFREEFLRRQHLACVDVQLDDCDPSSMTEEVRRRYVDAWVHQVSTGSHPADLQRYVRFINLLEERGIELTVAKKTRELAKLELSLINTICGHD
jgi:hypothetical protein